MKHGLNVTVQVTFGGQNNDIDQQTSTKIQGTVTILTDVSQLISGRIEVN